MFEIAAAIGGDIAKSLATQQNQPWWIVWMMPIIAVTIVPLASIKVVNWLKPIYHYYFGVPNTDDGKVLRWILYNITHFILTGTLAMLCWNFKMHDFAQSAVVGFLIACIQTLIVASVFAIIRRAAPALADKYEDAFQEESPPTIFRRKIVNKIKPDESIDT